MLIKWIFALSGFAGCWSGLFASVLRVDDLGTGVKNALIAPASELKYELRDFYQESGSQFGIRNSEFQILYNLVSRDGRDPGFANISAEGLTVYDQRPYLVVRTIRGQRWTNVAQPRVHEGGIWSSGYYRDFQLRPFVFDSYSVAVGAFQYHAFSDRLLEETRLAHEVSSIENVQEVYVEYPIEFSSYQVYRGSALTPVSQTEIDTGAVIIRRPNGSLLGFTFPESPLNGGVKIIEVDGELLVRHFADHTQHMESIKENTRVISWGRRIFAAANYDASVNEILDQMSEELNPLPSSAFTINPISGDADFYTQGVNPAQYDPIRGYYKYKTEGVPWGTAVRDLPNKYAGARVQASSSTPRNQYMMLETTSPDSVAVLQDDNGYTLPISIGVARSLGGQENPDWTGDHSRRDPFMTMEESLGWGRSVFPLRLQPNQPVAFRSFHVIHNWGIWQAPATASVVSHIPLFTSTVGVSTTVDLQPWRGSTGDFRGFSSTVTQWAWGEEAPGNEEQFAGGIHFSAPSIDKRARSYKGVLPVSHGLSHFRTDFLYSIDEGKADLAVTYSGLPDTRETRILVDVEMTVNEPMTIGNDERINLHSIMSDHVIFFNAFLRSTPDNSLSSSFIELPPELHIPSSHVQTVILEGDKPAYALVDKRWAFDPNTQFPTHETFARQEANVYLQVFEKDLYMEGQPANHVPLALRVAKEKPDGGYWSGGQFYEHQHYVTYDLVVEKGGFTLQPGDTIRASYMVMAYGGKASDNEVHSAQETHDHYRPPEMLSVFSGSPADDSYPWVPVVRSADGSTAEFEVQGGVDVMTVSVEGLHSYRPVSLYRIEGRNQIPVIYSVNGYDGYRSYVDSEGLIGISIPLDMNFGEPVTLRIVQDNTDVEDPDPPTSSLSVSSIPNQMILVNTGTGSLSFTISDEDEGPVSFTVSGTSSNIELVPVGNIVFGGSGLNRTVTVTPTAARTGISTVSVIVTDGVRTAVASFKVAVATDALVYEFNDGAFGDWTEVSTDSEGRQYFGITPAPVNSPHQESHSGAYFVGLHIPAFGGEPFYTQDSPHDTLVLRSPKFTLNGSGNLSVWLTGGGHGSPSLAGTRVDDLPAFSVDGGFRGVALRDVTNGTFVLSRARSAVGNEWEEIVLTAAQLAALPQHHTYTLDLIDAGHGGWGWVNMDSVTIPGTLPGDDLPKLTLVRWSESEVRISWPAAAAGWTLQSSEDLNRGFADAGLEIVVEANENAAYDTIPQGSKFYRLVR